MRPSLKQVMRRYWESHPIGVEAIEEEFGSPEFYRKYVEYFDQFYDYKWKAFEYEKYRGQKVLEIDPQTPTTLYAATDLGGRGVRVQDGVVKLCQSVGIHFWHVT